MSSSVCVPAVVLGKRQSHPLIYITNYDHLNTSPFSASESTLANYGQRPLERLGPGHCNEMPAIILPPNFSNLSHTIIELCFLVLQSR